MAKMNRRKCIQSSAAAGVAAAASTAPTANAGWFTRTTRSQTKALVIGSGFGGSVATLRLNDQVGAEWGTNGDELMGRNDINTSTAPIQGGPPSIAAFDTENPYKITGYMHSPTSVAKEFTQLQMGMVVPDQNSRVTYNRWTDKIKLNWDRDANENSHNALVHTMEKMVQSGGGKINEAGWFGTWHPLGGVAMGSACDLSGKVYGVEGLFVVDGAAIPGSSGSANPALTIAANAERMMEEIIPQIS